ncbi:uncharacterized protein [Chironomus tepperi]|uniref:uncharacterized protein n=1 Tax=Chironomus tepperi TaxID=113505 RepID=UPI00391FB985
MKICFIFVSFWLIFAHANPRQNSQSSSSRDQNSFDLNAIESVLQTDQKAIHDAIIKSIQQVETVVKTLEDNDIVEADNVKNLLGFLVDTSVPETILVRRKRQTEPIMALDTTVLSVDAAKETNCTVIKHSYQKANNLSDTARNVMTSSASGISSATDSMNSFLMLSTKADPFMKEIYMNLANTMNNLITIQTLTLNDMQNALFQLTYAGATFQERIAANNCEKSTDPPVVKYMTKEPRKTTTSSSTTTTVAASGMSQDAASVASEVQCPKCFLGTIQCPVILALHGPSTGTCPDGRTLITCSNSKISKCCCQ